MSSFFAYFEYTCSFLILGQAPVAQNHGVSKTSMFEMAHGVNFISLVTSCVGLREEESQTAHPMPFAWASHIATSVHYGM